MSLITCKGASFSYEGNTVVTDLSFEINSGDYLCIIGENGSGKSTLIKGLLRLKSPQSGSLTIDKSLSAKEIGYLPQQTSVQKDFPASAYEVIISGCLNTQGLRPFYSKNNKTIVDKNIKLLNIDNLRNKCYRELSIGQQQRVLLARALCATKKILLLDEPVSGLDPIVTQEFYQLIKKINQDNAITIIMVSHDIHSSVKYASHILHLKNKQIFFGKVDDYLKSSVGTRFLGGHRDD